MADNNLQVKISADVADLQAKFAVARAEANGLSAEMNKLARATASGVDPAAREKLQQVAGDMLRAQGAARALAAELVAAGGHVGSFANQARAEAAGIGGAFDSLSGKVNAALNFTGIGLAIEGLRKLMDVVSESSQRANEIQSMSQVLSVTTTQFQAMQIAAEEAGVGSDAMFRGVEKLVQILGEARDGSAAAIDKLHAVGITNAEIGDKSFGSAQLVAELSARLNNAGTAAATMAGITRELGARSALVAEGIKQMGGSLGEWNSKAAEANALSDQQVQRLHDIGASWSLVSRWIDNASAKLVLWTADAAKAAAAAALSGQSLSGSVLQGAAATMVGGSGDVKAAADAQATVQIQSQKQVAAANAATNAGITQNTLDSIRDQIEATQQGSAERLSLTRKLYTDTLALYGSGEVDKVKAAHRELIAEEREYGQQLKSEAEKRSAELIAQARTEVAEISGETAIGASARLEKEREVWAQLLTNEQLTADKRLEVQRALNAAVAALNREQLANSQAIARSSVDTDISIQRMQLDAVREQLTADLSLRKAHAAEVYDQLKELTRQEEALAEEALEKQRGDYTQDSAEYAKLTDRIRELRAKLNLDLATLGKQETDAVHREAEEQAQAWSKAVGEIESAESTMLGDLLAKRKSFSQAALQMVGQLVNQEIQNDLRAMTTRLLIQNQGLAAQKATEQGGLLYHMLTTNAEAQQTAIAQTKQVAAVAAGGQAQVAATTAAAGESKAAQAAIQGPAILADAAKAASGVYASVSSIPVVGWVLAPVAAAAAYATVAGYESLAGLDTGAWEIPSAHPYMLHPGESVVPRDFASGLRASGALDGGRGGDTFGDTNVNAHFHGAQMGPDQIMGHIQKMVRNAHPATLRRR